jgi:hypothetical protein
VIGYNAYSGDDALIPEVLDHLAEYGVIEATLILAGWNVPRGTTNGFARPASIRCSPKTRGQTRSSGASMDEVSATERAVGAPQS